MTKNVNCKNCDELIGFTAKRGQKTKTLTCTKGHKNSYNLATAKRSLSLPKAKVPKIKTDASIWTVLIIIGSALLGLVFGRISLPFLGWVFQAQPWYWSTILWTIAWGCLGGFIAFRNRIK